MLKQVTTLSGLPVEIWRIVNTLDDETYWQVLGEDGEMDAEATQSAIAAHLANQ